MPMMSLPALSGARASRFTDFKLYGTNAKFVSVLLQSGWLSQNERHPADFPTSNHVLFLKVHYQTPIDEVLRSDFSRH